MVPPNEWLGNRVAGSFGISGSFRIRSTTTKTDAGSLAETGVGQFPGTPDDVANQLCNAFAAVPVGDHTVSAGHNIAGHWNSNSVIGTIEMNTNRSSAFAHGDHGWDESRPAKVHPFEYHDAVRQGPKTLSCLRAVGLVLHVAQDHGNGPSPIPPRSPNEIL